MNRRHIFLSFALIVIFILLGFYALNGTCRGSLRPFCLGLDLQSGTELVYRADTSKLDDSVEAMQSLKEVMERRVNIFGVSEPIVQTEEAGLVSGHKEDRLIIGLPGVTDVEEAKRIIGETPVLEFRLENPGARDLPPETEPVLDDLFISTELTGRYLSRAQVQFDPTTQIPVISIEFKDEGRELLARLTREHKGEILAIVLDGEVLSTPVIQDEITDGKAQITGSFSPEEARDLARNLNYGALPVKIEFDSSQTVGASLGEEALTSGVRAGIIGFIAVSVFLIMWYRLPGLIAALALVTYIILSLSLFKFIPVTLTAAGVAGFILSIGMAVDANVLIFERIKEELARGKSIRDAAKEGFSRAWLSIRDSNTSSIITAIVLFWLGTSAVKGFALTLGIGVLISIITEIGVSRTFLYAVAPANDTKVMRFLFGSGLSRK